MSATEPWTIARIAEAIPAPATRMRFLSEVNLAPVDDLPAVVAKWQKVAEELAAGYERAVQVRDHIERHGQLPPEYVRVSPAELRESAGLDAKGAA
ncbi:hypothetical protein [Streptomyces himalayensis]|uniref:Uncharacterized protein n=1 Tax=Streptomyces himalayensis subsp. himalayensis TaxID=2756131 RepID=A0A7W0DFX1_9ACTN|nr:hypothetical protein [Streptomyces himalayensis]MBA2944324.1 hypothetical protein [Streptomyces himalayensis subsp. himalayensis]